MRFMMGLTAAVVIAGAAAAQTTPMVTYFGAGADDLDPAALAILDGVVDQARAKTESWSVVVAGHADASEGSPDETVGLSQRRANRVRDGLVARGVPASLITTQAFGQSRPAVEGSGAQAENRRVEITFGGGSGW